ncbi:hypothetical protein SmJEL517_g01846 [Synchytrium microbalum]|uniref:Uncharacterized protein n=1 Tax=Synchytrium microbalum TaxID=1806994 RepID=A0A507C9R5_9FUNG|nr:uncharacterized protein SmJEL517_g01846 [Synchytrium microbalum]TPX35909.1 hypothetical protein SmJEL517_g01846 [Synchytrium microbalum]
MAPKAAASSKNGERSGKNFNPQIFAEAVKKEMRTFKPYETFMLSPNIKKRVQWLTSDLLNPNLDIVLSQKPTDSVPTGTEGVLDQEYFLREAQRNLAPRDKYPAPLTASQAYGWDTRPIMILRDERFHHPKKTTEITRTPRPAPTPKADKKGGK